MSRTVEALSSQEGFGTYVGTIVVLLLIAVTIVIMRMMSRSLKRMRANVAEHPENFGIAEEDTDE